MEELKRAGEHQLQALFWLLMGLVSLGLTAIAAIGALQEHLRDCRAMAGRRRRGE